MNYPDFSILEQNGIKLIGEYINIWTRANWVCSQGHEFSKAWYRLKKTQTCPVCNVKKQRYSLEEIKTVLAQNDFEMLCEAEYVGTHFPVRVLDKKGQKETIIYVHSLLQGYSCRKRIVTKEEVVDTLGKEGYKLLGDYFNTKHEFLVECPRGHRFTTLFNTFTSGKRCRECFYYSRLQTNEEIASRLATCSYVLLTTDERISHTQIIDVKCNKGHLFQTDMKHFMVRGQRCPTCATNKKRTPIAKVKEAFFAVGFTLLSTDHDDQVLRFICNKGHYSSVTWQEFVWGYRCGVCFPKTLVTEKQLKELTLKYNTNLLTVTSKYGAFTAYCQNGHEFKSTINQFVGCPICNATPKKTIEEIKTALGKEGYLLESGVYNNNKEKLRIKCPNNHIFNSSWNNWLYGCRCPSCCASTSYSEKEVLKEVLAVCPDAVHRYKFDGNKRQELDIFVPSKKVAIEYNGVFWHSDKAIYATCKKDPKKREEKLKHCVVMHKEKTDACRLRGIKLLTVFENEWIEKKDVVVTKIQTALGVSQKVEEDWCEIAVIGTDITHEFINHNAFATINFDHSFGQYFNNILVAVLLEKDGVISVVEKCGYSLYSCNKLINFAKDLTKRNFFITTIDMRYDNSETFLNSGFVFAHSIGPRPHNVFRQTIVEHATGVKIWDCGHLILIYR